MHRSLALLSIGLLFLLTLPVIAQPNTQMTHMNPETTLFNGGIGLGSVIAVTASWSRNQSVLWAIIHGILGWLYVIYFVLTRRGER